MKTIIKLKKLVKKTFVLTLTFLLIPSLLIAETPSECVDRVSLARTNAYAAADKDYNDTMAAAAKKQTDDNQASFDKAQREFADHLNNYDHAVNTAEVAAALAAGAAATAAGIKTATATGIYTAAVIAAALLPPPADVAAYAAATAAYDAAITKIAEDLAIQLVGIAAVLAATIYGAGQVKQAADENTQRHYDQELKDHQKTYDDTEKAAAKKRKDAQDAADAKYNIDIIKCSTEGPIVFNGFNKSCILVTA